MSAPSLAGTVSAPGIEAKTTRLIRTSIQAGTSPIPTDAANLHSSP